MADNFAEPVRVASSPRKTGVILPLPCRIAGKVARKRVVLAPEKIGMSTRMSQDNGGLTTEELVRLRASVREWTKRGEEALAGFEHKDTGSFYKNSTDAEDWTHVNVTTTARAYTAMYAVDRASSGRRGGGEAPAWVAWLKTFLGTKHLQVNDTGFVETTKASTKKDFSNYFDIAHYTDFIIAANYANRFHKSNKKLLTGFEIYNKPAVAKTRMVSMLKEAIRDSCEGPIRKGQVLFETGEEDSRHFFATLHSLRGLHALNAKYDEPNEADPNKRPFDSGLVDDAVEGARLFAIEQCYYYQRGATHRQDPVRLAFAGCIYAIYSLHIDKDLCCAIIESLASAQQDNGSWPATHPIIRKDRRLPWHITNHEVALCLTWLYFQPRIPDAARPILVAMMRKHFQRAVIPTFVTTATAAGQPMRGWQDDHTVSPNMTVGWATAIVTHFLANFSLVLKDYINRLVIEDLQLEGEALHYLIDDTMTEDSRSLRWRHAEDAAKTLAGRAVWPDLPPNAWTDLETPASLAARISDNWTDPSRDGDASAAFAAKVLHPLLTDPAERPLADKCAGLLPGEPGTRKTSFVKQIARILHWPMVPVPASLIFADGFEMMEARANEVFRKLSYLRTVVIFFDEFEEFFLRRDAKPNKNSDANTGDSEPAGNERGAEHAETQDHLAWTIKSPLPVRVIEGFHNRTIAAFTTSAMLPRLQGLHDVGACLIFLATNHAEKIDSAIKRPGRFDYTLTINYPGHERLSAYLAAIPEGAAKKLGLDKPTSQGIKAAVIAAVDSYEGDEGHSPKDKLQFGQVEGVIRELVERCARGKCEDLAGAAAASLNAWTQLEAEEGNPQELVGS